MLVLTTRKNMYLLSNTKAALVITILIFGVYYSLQTIKKKMLKNRQIKLSKF